MHPTILAENITKSYDRHIILNGISLALRSGTITGIIGANGSGKSTLLSIIAGTLRPDSGTILLQTAAQGSGEDAGEAGGAGSRRRRIRDGEIGYVPQTNPLLEQLSVRDNLSFWCENRQRRQEVLAEYGFEELARKRVAKLSGGMKRRLAIACALSHAPVLLVMDEPAAGLDIYYKRLVHRQMLDFCGGGGAILLATHEQEEMHMCGELYELRGHGLVPSDIVSAEARIPSELPQDDTRGCSEILNSNRLN